MNYARIQVTPIAWALGAEISGVDLSHGLDDEIDTIAASEVSHPIVRTHPETGRKALFVNDHYVVRIKDMTEAESRPLLDYLFAHAILPEFTCRLRWTKNMIAMWDNRCTLHSPVADYFGHRRKMHRITIEGDHPR